MPPDAIRLSYVSIFTRDVTALPSFYVELFGLQEVETSRSDRYRELMLGETLFGFPHLDAYEALDMADQAEPTGVRSMLTFRAESADAVVRLTERAVALGARLIKAPFATGFGHFLSVLLDPESNAFRVSGPLS
jgi:predicted enzyme related to lactoylglutathione lyase